MTTAGAGVRALELKRQEEGGHTCVVWLAMEKCQWRK